MFYTIVYQLIKHIFKDLSTILGQSSRVTVYEAQKKLAAQKDPTDENVERLLTYSNNCIDSNTTNKVFDIFINF